MSYKSKSVVVFFKVLSFDNKEAMVGQFYYSFYWDFCLHLLTIIMLKIASALLCPVITVDIGRTSWLFPLSSATVLKIENKDKSF